MTPSNNQPNPEEIRAQLAKMGFQETPADAAEPPTLNDDELMDALNVDSYADEDVTRIPIPEEAMEGIEPPEKERLLRLDGGKPEVDPWVRYVQTLGAVTVTEHEKETYHKALLFDQRFETAIDLPMGDEAFRVRIRSLYASEKEVMALAVSKLVEEYPVVTLNNAATATAHYFRMLILTQVVSFGGKIQEPYDARTEPSQLAEHSPKVAELARLARTSFGEMHQAKFKALMKALQIFETKQVILEDALGNRDF
jgi:hypothetical protein